MPRVQYHDSEISDFHTHDVLQRIATALGADINVVGGDRQRADAIQGSSSKSLHYSGRAADFHVVGMSDSQAFEGIRQHVAEIFDADKGYEMLHHGKYTATQAEHLHVGHYQQGRSDGVKFKTEGLKPETRGKYETIEKLRLSDDAPKAERPALAQAAPSISPARARINELLRPDPPNHDAPSHSAPSHHAPAQHHDTPTLSH